MKYRKISSNNIALSLVQDTLLFLVFISISALILTPAIIKSPSNANHYDYLGESKVDETLHTLLSITKHNYSFITGNQYIDELANTIGIDTSQNNGLYHMITSHFLSKQQSHKSIAQLITEHLATQYSFVQENTTLQLNPFSGDSQQQITLLLSNELIRLLPPHTFFNLSACWYPIRNIPFGGKITIGEPIPSSISTYSSFQILSMPFLPCIELDDETFCFSSYNMKHLIQQFSKDIEPFNNISLLSIQSKNIDKKNISVLLFENISSVLLDVFINGIRDYENDIVIPSVIDVLISKTFSLSTYSFSTVKQSESTENCFRPINSLFTLLSHKKNLPEISSYMLSNYGNFLNQYIKDNVFSTISGFVSFIKQNIGKVLMPLVIRLSDYLSDQFFSKNNIIPYPNLIVDTIFDNLSLSTATISLTIWDG